MLSGNRRQCSETLSAKWLGGLATHQAYRTTFGGNAVVSENVA
jgi:hypothetical protein